MSTLASLIRAEIAAGGGWIGFDRFMELALYAPDLGYYSNQRVKFGIKAKDRTKHVYVIGKTGMGKSTLLENMAVQDIQNGEGLAFIDPHGKTADLLQPFADPGGHGAAVLADPHHRGADDDLVPVL